MGSIKIFFLFCILHFGRCRSSHSFAAGEAKNQDRRLEVYFGGKQYAKVSTVHRRTTGDDPADLAMGDSESFASGDEGSPSAWYTAEGDVNLAVGISYGFFEGTTVRMPTDDEIGHLVESTEKFFFDVLATQDIESFQFEVVDVTLDESSSVHVFDNPVAVSFNCIASFNEGATLPTEADLFAMMDAANFEDYITEYVWKGSQGGLFFDTQSVQFTATRSPDGPSPQDNDSLASPTTSPLPQDNDGPESPSTQDSDGLESNGTEYDTFAPSTANEAVGKSDDFFFPLSNPIIAPEASVGVVLNETRLTYGFFSGFARSPTGDEYEYLITQTSEFFTNTAMEAFPNFMSFQSKPLVMSYAKDRAHEISYLFNAHAFFQEGTDIPSEDEFLNVMIESNLTGYIYDYVWSDLFINTTVAAFDDIESVHVRQERKNPVPLYNIELQFGFFAGTTVYDPTQEEIMDLLLETNRFYTYVLSNNFTNPLTFEVNEDLVSWFYDDNENTGLPVSVSFSANVTFEDDGDIPLSTELSDTMAQAAYDDYIQNYVWNAVSESRKLFFDTQQVQFKRGF